MPTLLYLGLDIGSTTIKQVYLDSHEHIVYARYQRHYSDVRGTLTSMLAEAAKALPHVHVVPVMTGSAGIGISSLLNIPFFQEVMASSLSIQRFIPQTDVAIELGGEDAKITFFDGSIDQRMNETCAGGTGAFIDQMASFLKVEAKGLNELAKNATTIYPIAARCGVFAKTDIMPLLNEGAAKEDIAASIFQAVVDQTIGGLACGRAIKGNIAFLGGPLFYLNELRQRFITSLALTPKQVLLPENAQLFVALGAALESIASSKNQGNHASLPLTELVNASEKALAHVAEETSSLPPLFQSEETLALFKARHNSHSTPREDFASHKGPVFIGFDVGSTTIKAAVITTQGAILYSHYEHSQGEPLVAAVSVLKDIYTLLPSDAYIARVGTTGYGGNLIFSAFGADFEEVETVSHYRAAKELHPDVSFILDIGGQDMKCLHIEEDIIDRIMLNEACSAGCGIFIETFAQSLGMTNEEFIKQALTSKNPIDLGSRCTVFMNSKVKQAQKEGASVGDIAAGLAYSVIRNALYKVIQAPNTASLGTHVVAQGGAFLNDALLRAFELLLEREIFRPDISGVMGAYGAALLGKDQYFHQGETTGKEKCSTLITFEEIKNFSFTSRTLRCKKCQNHCLLTLNTFNDGRKHVSGNKCERGIIQTHSLKQKKHVPNLYEYKYRRLFDYYKPLPHKKAQRGSIGIPRALNMYENYPFWFTFFTQLGYRVELSSPSSKKLYDEGLSTIPSQTVCFPAKLSHGHILDLIEKGITCIFFPSITYEQKEFRDTDASYNCPVVIGYPELLKLNIDALSENTVTLHVPFLPFDSEKHLRRRLQKEVRVLPHGESLGKREVEKAISLAFKEMKRFRKHIQRVGSRVTAEVIEGKGTECAVILAGHPYHVDPGINHGISSMLTEMGVTVLTEDSIAHLASPPKPLRVVNQWTYHARLYRAAALAALYPQISFIQLTSFGCGLDAVTAGQVQEILEESGRIFTLLKIDEGNNLGSARIRIRSLLAAEKAKNQFLQEAPTMQEQSPPRSILPHTHSISLPRMEDVRDALRFPAHPLPRTVRRGEKPLYTELHKPFTEEMRKTHTILVPQVSPLHFQFVEKALESEGYKVELLPNIDQGAIETGLNYVNNDVCYPALLTIGQLMQAVESGKYDPDKVALILSQTGGGCRATNYIAFLRKALADAGLSQIPVISFNISGLEKNPGFPITQSLLKKSLRGLMYGDVLSRVYYRTRPYEKHQGEASKVLHQMSLLCRENLCKNDKNSFMKTIETVVEAFANIPIQESIKPRVGIVGEIYLKYNEDANNHLIDVIEQEGGEAVPNDLVTFVLYCLHGDIYKASYLSGTKRKAVQSSLAIWWIERIRDQVRKVLCRYPRFGTIETIFSMAKKAKKILQLGHDAGEGWLLSAEMLAFIETDVHNIVCVQPFGCLPNHITGKGIVKKLKKIHPLTNIAAVDYDAGASVVNQLNRIKLMMAMAHKNIDHTNRYLP